MVDYVDSYIQQLEIKFCEMNTSKQLIVGDHILANFLNKVVNLYIINMN